MLLLALAKLSAPVVAFLAIAPLASAELRQGPTGVEYVKRFQPSSAANPCVYEGPDYTPTFDEVEQGTLPGAVAPATPEGSNTDDPSQTLCSYTVSTTDGPAPRICIYGIEDGEGNQLENFLFDGDVGCSGTASQVCPAKRALSPLEKLVRARQYSPKRRAA